MKLSKPCFLMFFLLSFTTNSFADALECVRSSLGERVLWQRSWQNDFDDHGIRYKIEQVQKTELSSGGVRLQLRAIDTARRTRRIVKINTPSVAQLFCASILKRKLSIPKIEAIAPDAPPPKASASKAPAPVAPPAPALPQAVAKVTKAQEGAALLPFIYFSDTGWVRGKKPKEAELRICRISHMRFSCTSSDKSLHSPQLESIEDELQANPR